MLRRLHLLGPFWVSLWLSSLLCLLVLPLWLSQAPGAAGEDHVKAASGWSWMPTEWVLEEEKEDLSEKDAVPRPAPKRAIPAIFGTHASLHPLSCPQARYALRPVFLAYHHLRL